MSTTVFRASIFVLGFLLEASLPVYAQLDNEEQLLVSVDESGESKGLEGSQYDRKATSVIEGDKVGDVEREAPGTKTEVTATANASSAPKLLLNPATWINVFSWSKSEYEFLADQQKWKGMLTNAQQHWQQAQQPEAVIGKIVPAAQPVVDGVTKMVKENDVTVPSNVLYVRFSKSFLEKYFCKNFEDVRPVRDTMLGASVQGTARTIAHTELELVEDPLHVNAVLTFKGTNAFNTVSSKDVVQVFCRGTTRFTSKKRLSFDGMDVRQSAPTTRASTESTITNVTTSLPGLRGRIALRVANDRVAESQPLAKQITTDRTKRKVEAAFSRVMEERADVFTEELKAQYAKLPFEGRFSIKEIQCSTTPDRLQIVVVGRGEKEPTFVPPPALVSDGPDIEVHIHTAVIGKAILDSAFREALQSAVTELVEKPMKLVNTTARKSSQKEPERTMKIHWAEGNGLEWLSLGWHANDKVAVNRKPITTGKR